MRRVISYGRVEKYDKTGKGMGIRPNLGQMER